MARPAFMVSHSNLQKVLIPQTTTGHLADCTATLMIMNLDEDQLVCTLLLCLSFHVHIPLQPNRTPGRGRRRGQRIQTGRQQRQAGRQAIKYHPEHHPGHLPRHYSSSCGMSTLSLRLLLQHQHAAKSQVMRIPGATATCSSLRASMMSSASFTVPWSFIHMNMPASGGSQLASPSRCCTDQHQS